jgi:hypothetical protein
MSANAVAWSLTLEREGSAELLLKRSHILLLGKVHLFRYGGKV